jgi:hypothetical protein
MNGNRGQAGRAKRDLDLDPEELLNILSYWENERRNKLQQAARLISTNVYIMSSTGKTYNSLMAIDFLTR